jgi:hypothetical protein
MGVKFAIDYPSDWSWEKSLGMIIISPPDADTLYTFSNSLSIKEGVVVYPPEPTMHTTLEELARVSLPSLLNSTYISNVSIDEFSTAKVFLLGHPAMRAVYSAKVGQTQTEAKFLDEKAIIDKMGYSIGFPARIDKYDSLLPVAEDIINSFREIS